SPAQRPRADRGLRTCQQESVRPTSSGWRLPAGPLMVTPCSLSGRLLERLAEDQQAPIGCPYVEVAHPVGPVIQWLHTMSSPRARSSSWQESTSSTTTATLAGLTLLSAYRWNSAVSRITAA